MPATPGATTTSSGYDPYRTPTAPTTENPNPAYFGPQGPGTYPSFPLPTQGFDPFLAALLQGLGAGQKPDIGPDLARIGIQRGALERQRGLLGPEHEMAMQLLEIQKQQAGRGAVRGRQQLSGEAASRGAIGAIGYGRGMSDIHRALAQQLQQLRLQRGAERRRFGEARSGIGDQLRMLGIDERALRTQAGRARAADTLAQLLPFFTMFGQQGPSLAGGLWSGVFGGMMGGQQMPGGGGAPGHI